MAEYLAYVNSSLDDDQISVSFDIHIPPAIELPPTVIVEAIYNSISGVEGTNHSPVVTRTTLQTVNVTPDGNA